MSCFEVERIKLLISLIEDEKSIVVEDKDIIVDVSANYIDKYKLISYKKAEEQRFFNKFLKCLEENQTFKVKEKNSKQILDNEVVISYIKTAIQKCLDNL